MEQDVRNLFSSKKCSHCGGESDGWKCPKCGKVSEHFDPLHWKDCSSGGKMKVKCRACGEAEDNCSCAAVKLNN